MLFCSITYGGVRLRKYSTEDLTELIVVPPHERTTNPKE